MTMADALAVAQAEGGEATPPAVETGLPPVETNAEADGEQAPATSLEQPAADSDGFDADAKALGDALMSTVQDSQDDSGSGAPVPGSEDFLNLNVDVQTVNGPEAVTIRELTDGYLRQADYTRKTQSLAEQKKQVERASEFLTAFESDPAGFARSLAVQAGLIEEGDVPVREVPIAQIPTPEDLDTMVNEMVEERVNNDERVRSAAEANARIQVDAEFDRIAEHYAVELKPGLRDDILSEAFKTGSADLEGIVAKRIALHQQKQQRADAANLASTSRPGSAPVGSSVDDANKPTPRPSMREAWNQAKVAASQQ